MALGKSYFLRSKHSFLALWFCAPRVKKLGFYGPATAGFRGKSYTRFFRTKGTLFDRKKSVFFLAHQQKR